MKGVQVVKYAKEDWRPHFDKDRGLQSSSFQYISDSTELRFFHQIMISVTIRAKALNTLPALSLSSLGIFGVGWFGSTVLTQQLKDSKAHSKASNSQDLGTYVWW
ncbi:hypothetical protein K7432_007258 [Basidiobolus ranarum]|uniref:Uncharacterized protein n=1 Tax=Basidiobolus ranarum TaxID=34480 RepID=A0ABR2W0B6_9FUNG